MDPADDDGAGKKNGEEEPEFSASAFEALERDFQEVSMPWTPRYTCAAHRPAHADKQQQHTQHADVHTHTHAHALALATAAFRVLHCHRHLHRAALVCRSLRTWWETSRSSASGWSTRSFTGPSR